jgi:cell division protein FtsW
MFPNTGITLPFFSYGGSSLVVLLFEMGILLAISKQYYRKKSDLRKK